MKTARILAILQLSIIFSILCWNGSYPFMGSLFEQKQESLQYQFIMGEGELIERVLAHSPEKLGQVKSNQPRFEKLTLEERQLISDSYEKALVDSQSSFLTKVLASLKHMAFEIPALQRAWLVLATVAALMVLLRKEQATPTAWLAFVMAAIILSEAIFLAPPLPKTTSLTLPSEEYLIKQYGLEPLPTEIYGQYEMLHDLWKKYLITEWAGLSPSEDPSLLAKQAEDGEYLYQLAKLREKIESSPIHSPYVTTSKVGGFLLLFWSLVFSLIITNRFYVKGLCYSFSGRPNHL